MFRAQVLPMASEVLPMGNTTLTSIAVQRTTAAYVVYSFASPHRGKKRMSDTKVLVKTSGIFVFVSAPLHARGACRKQSINSHRK